MGDRKAKLLKAAGAVGIDREAARSGTGTDSEALQLRLVTQTCRSLSLREGEDPGSVVQAALDALAAIDPRDGFEGMIAVQMVAVHDNAMECFRRAALPDQTVVGRDLNLKHAAKLLQIYAKQVEALDKHRGKGQQKITVEHVTIEAGGQAILRHGQVGEHETPPALTDERENEALNRAPLPTSRRKLRKSGPDRSTNE